MMSKFLCVKCPLIGQVQRRSRKGCRIFLEKKNYLQIWKGRHLPRTSNREKSEQQISRDLQNRNAPKNSQIDSWHRRFTACKSNFLQTQTYRQGDIACKRRRVISEIGSTFEITALKLQSITIVMTECLSLLWWSYKLSVTHAHIWGEGWANLNFTTWFYFWMIDYKFLDMEFLACECHSILCNVNFWMETGISHASERNKKVKFPGRDRLKAS